jgi:two-component system C4-dicarboxylate transport response regulator DctD
VLGIRDDALRFIPAVETLADQVRRFERALIRYELHKNRGDVPITSKMLRVPVKTLYDKIQRHGIDLQSYRGMEMERSEHAL